MYAAVTAPPAVRKPDRCGPVQNIAWEEAVRAGITYAQIIGEQRQRKFVAARHQAMWRASRETAASLKLIGRVFGHRDHSTVMYAIRKVESELVAANDNAANDNAANDNVAK
jgi:chromosomal replication initiation ATPase DnaA